MLGWCARYEWYVWYLGVRLVLLDERETVLVELCSSHCFLNKIMNWKIKTSWIYILSISKVVLICVWLHREQVSGGGLFVWGVRGPTMIYSPPELPLITTTYIWSYNMGNYRRWGFEPCDYSSCHLFDTTPTLLGISLYFQMKAALSKAHPTTLHIPAHKLGQLVSLHSVLQVRGR